MSYRINKITFGDKNVSYVLEKKNWIGKWTNAFPMTQMTFPTIELAEKAYAHLTVDPLVEVVKELT